MQIHPMYVKIVKLAKDQSNVIDLGIPEGGHT